MDKHTKSEYLQKLYSIYNSDENHHDHEQHHGNHFDDCEKEPIGKNRLDRMKFNCLHDITKHMCKKSIPCDDNCNDSDELNAAVDKAVSRYFVSNQGKILQYFTDTKNTVTDIINNAFEDALTNVDISTDEDDDEEFIATVVKNVTDDKDVEKVIAKIEDDIKKSAEDDIKKIIDNVKDDEDEIDQNEMTVDDNINESVFHRYLIKQYKENIVPDDPEELLMTPMVETALHYVRRVLFSDGFARRRK